MSAAEITELIDEVDDLMDMKLDTGALTANVRRAISRTWTSFRVMLKDPNARSLAEYSERRDVQLQLLKKELDDMLSIADGGVKIVARMEPI